MINADGTRAPWFKTDVIVGNPPFLGAKLLKPAYGSAYVDKVRHAYPDVPGMADFCVYWFRRAHDELDPCTVNDPVAGRAGLVGTQNVRNNASRIGGLDHIAATGSIIEAVDNQPWSGEANVHVSIANWVKTQESALLPKVNRLWFKITSTPGAKKRPRGAGSLEKHYELDMREVTLINSSLSDEVDVSKAQSLRANEAVVIGQGITPGHAGFILSDDERAAMLNAHAASEAVIHPYMIGDDVVGPGRPTRWIIDFGSMSIIQAQAYKAPFERLRAMVLPAMQEVAAVGSSERSSSMNAWWQHWRPRGELVSTIAGLPRYLACSRVTKRPLFAFVDASVRPGDALQVFGLADDYSFGVLQSSAHWLWFITKCGKLTERLRYNGESVFSTFPWPQAPSAAAVDAVVAAGRAVRNIRSSAAQQHSTGLRVLYRTLDLPGKNPLKEAHSALDSAVLKAYGFSPRRDLLQQLFDLNQQVASQNGAGVGPGVPPGYKHPAALVTADSFGGRAIAPSGLRRSSGLKRN